MANTDTGRAAGTFFGVAPGNRLLNEHEAAYALGLKVATLRRWRWAGRELPFFKIGAAVRYAAEDIDAFIQAARRTSTSDAGSAGA